MERSLTLYGIPALCGISFFVYSLPINTSCFSFPSGSQTFNTVFAV